MQQQNVGSYGVSERGLDGDSLDLAVEELTRMGYTFLESGLDPSAIEELGEHLLAVYRRQAEELVDGSLAESSDADVARCALAYDDRFLELATNPRLLEFCGRVFGPSFVLLQQNGLINRPSRTHFQLRWHRDLPYQHWVASKPIALAALFCIEPFTERTGGTYALPASHLHSAFPSEAFVRQHQVAMTAEPGTFIVMDAMLYHRAGKNASDDVRRGVNHLIGLPFLAQQIDIPRMLGGAHADNPTTAAYLGYKWGPAPTVRDWRESRFSDK